MNICSRTQQGSQGPRPARFLTTGAAAKRLGLSRDGLLKLAHEGALAFEWVEGGQLLFHRSEVQRYLLQRGDEAARRNRGDVLRAIHLRMAKASIEPQQLSFLHGLGLRIVARGERPLCDRRVKRAQSFEQALESYRESSVNRKVGAGR